MPARRRRRWRHAERRRAIASSPSLLKPKRLIIACWSGRRKQRGWGLPGWGRGVTVPTSTEPKPSASRPSMASAFLSKPAAMPTGLGKSSPHSRWASTGSHLPPIGGVRPVASSRMVTVWASSGERQRSSGPVTGKRSITRHPQGSVASVGRLPDGNRNRRRMPADCSRFPRQARRRLGANCNETVTFFAFCTPFGSRDRPNPESPPAIPAVSQRFALAPSLP